MSPALAIVFAQVINLGVHDRTEVRRVVLNDHHYEAETTPSATLAFLWPHYDLTLNYGASLLELPLESKSRRLLVYHTIVVGTSYQFRRTKLALNSRTSFGELNFLVAALANPTLQPQPAANPGDTATPPAGQTGGDGMTTTPPAQGGDGTTQPKPPTTPAEGVQQTRAVNRAVRYETSTTTAQVTHTLSRELTLGASTSYTIAGGLDAPARVDYPTVRGTTVGVQGTHVLRWTGRDSFVLDATGQQAWSSNRNVVTSLLGTENWRHAFDKRSGSVAGVGISVVRFARFDGLVAYSIFPTFQLGVAQSTLVARGTLNLQANVYSNPALDPLRATIDPRLGAAVSVGWTGKRFSTSLTGNAAYSVAPQVNNAGAFDALRATFLMGYRLTDWLVADTGARVAQQTFQNTSIIPISYTIFAALNLGYERALNGRH